jgi:hypothetical protein
MGSLIYVAAIVGAAAAGLHAGPALAAYLGLPDAANVLAAVGMAAVGAMAAEDLASRLHRLITGKQG